MWCYTPSQTSFGGIGWKILREEENKKKERKEKGGKEWSLPSFQEVGSFPT